MQNPGIIRSALLATALAFMVTSRPALAAPPASGVVLSRSSVKVEVDVASTIDERDRLRGWLESKMQSVLAESESSGRIGTMRVEVTGGLYDYQVTLTTSRNGTPLGEAVTWDCECSNEELLGTVSSEVPAVASRLELEDIETKDDARPPPPRVVHTAQHDGPTVIDDRELVRPSPKSVGAVGITMITLGALGVAGGIPMVIIQDRIGRPDQYWLDRDEIDLRPPGIAIASTGAGLLVIGSVLYAIHRRKNRRSKASENTALIPSTNANTAFTLTLSGKF